jgi:hypothetical protein
MAPIEGFEGFLGWQRGEPYENLGRLDVLLSAVIRKFLITQRGEFMPQGHRKGVPRIDKRKVICRKFNNSRGDIFVPLLHDAKP